MENFNFHELAKPLREKVRPLISAELEKYIQEYGVDGFYRFAQRYLEMVNVRPVFTKEQDPCFTEWRHRLQHDKGVVISNHPSLLDMPLLMEAIQRSDLKIVVNMTLYQQTQQMALHDMYIPAAGADTPLSFQKLMITAMRDHLASNGLLFIFPTGGRELETDTLEFAHGFSHILDMLDDKDMVYSFHIDSESLNPVSNSIKVNSSILSDFFLPELLNPAKMRETQEIYIDELCQNAGDWKQIKSAQAKGDVSSALTSYYLDLFDIPKKELFRLHNKGQNKK